ncbi:MAG: carbamoyltransferase [gamma proteobacterium symbiont of Taylorina sp.]|nr:carbamoyltransferase [gamma proteobacterium symbiont of Taylorina sp.]
MYILGLNDSNSAAAIIKDGILLAAAREERFDRIKFSDAYPTNAVNYCLREANISLKDVDHIVFAWNPGHEIEPQESAAAVRAHKDFLHYIPNNLLRHISGDKLNKKITAISEKINFHKGNIDLHFVPHHYSHAASSFFVSPYNHAAILTLDAYGDDITSQFFIGNENKLEAIGDTKFPHSMGQVFAAITQYLGYRANSDEWKVMGLAAFGDENKYYEQFSKLIRFDQSRGELRFDLDYFSFYFWSPRRYSEQFIELFGAERYEDDELSQHHMDIAASFQKRVEDVVLEMCDYLYKKTGFDTLCLSGGCTMNSKMNGRIEKESAFKNVWLASSSDDAGCSIGACYYYWNQVLEKERSFNMSHDYFGPEYTNAEIKAALDDSLISYDYLENPYKEAAKSIAENKIICWFQGRMEFGQRALGNRSILGDPRDIKMKDKINHLVKHREWYRPFAPSILEEYQSDFFHMQQSSPFMQKIYDFKEEKKSIVPAVVHKDGTGRLQTVNKNDNEKYWCLINEFRKLTGVPLLLNTSFNDNDEPIICTPKQAIRTFFGTGLHELYIGNYRIKKQGF